MGTSPPAADPTPPEQGGPSYVRLSETGLYANIASKALSPDLTFFQPSHFLWSDGTEKRRWLRLPAGSRIDSSDMDNWQLPVGTQVFKEFSLGGVLLETRLIERYGPGPSDYWMGSFVWSADASDAVFAPLGSENVVGTGHDVPSTAACQQCHIGEAGRLLGFTAVQLSGQREGATLSSLAASGVLSNPPPAGADYGTPGDPTTAAALGYLHANCGHCHNPRGIGYQFNDLELRLSVGESSPALTGAYRTALGQPLTVPVGSLVFRVRRGFPEESAVWQLMNTRTAAQKMPPLATELIDPAGLGLVEDWIRSLE
jgi:hypothetical protein